MTNVPFTSIEQFRDIETLNMHRLHLAADLPESDFIAGANANGRDNARTPMQWRAAPHGGFTTGTPWIEANPNCTEINVEASLADEASILAHYRRLVALRKELPVMVHGRYRSYLDEHPQIVAYTRTLGGQRIVVIANFTGGPVVAELPDELQVAGASLVANYLPVSAIDKQVLLQPFEAFALYSQQ